MEPAATIRQLRFDVQTASVGLGRELPERFSRLFHAQLEAVLADELARVAAPGPVRHLPQLVLELPPIAPDRLEQDLPEHLREALRRALASLGAQAGPGQTAAADPLAGLRYYLVNGRLPWQLSTSAFELDAAVARALRQHPQALVALLRQVGQQLWPRQRLAGQLAPATIDQVIGLLAPTDAPLVRAYLTDTLAAHRRRPLVPAPEPALRQVLHELVLADLLTGWHTQFNRQAFVERQLRGLAAHYGLDLTALLLQLVAVLPLAGPPQPQATTLPGIVHTLYQQQLKSGPELQAAAPAAPPDVNAALSYYLRRGSLPPAPGPPLTLAELAAEAAQVLRQGRGALLALARAAGARKAAAGLLALLPPSQHPELIRRLALGQARPVLALLDELAGPAGAAQRPQLWQQALVHLLAFPADGATPALQRWLPVQVPGLIAAAAADGSTREQLFHYLLTGEISLRGNQLTSPAQLRRELRELLVRHDGALTDFLHLHQGRPEVLQRLAALAGFELLSQLLPTAARASQRLTATRAALAALLGEPAGQFSSSGRTSRQQLLREAYLMFHLRGRAGTAGPGANDLQRVLQVHRLPGRALLSYLRQQLHRWPVLAGSSFFKWLVDGLRGVGTYSSQQGEQLANRRKRTSKSGQREPRIEEGLFHEEASAEPEMRPVVSDSPIQEAVGSPSQRPEATRWLLAATAASRFWQKHAGSGAADLHLAWPSTAAEGLAQLAAYRPSASALAKGPAPLLRWLAAREPAQVAAWLSAQLARDSHWPGQTALLDFPLLRRLLARARPAARQGLAALESLASRELAGSQRLNALLRVAVLLGHFRPAGAGALLARLATAYGLPHRATATRLRKLGQRQPALAAAPGWQLLAAALLNPMRLSSRPATATIGPEALAGPFGLGKVVGLPEEPAATAPGRRLASGTGKPPTPDDTAPGRHDLLFHYLLHGKAPWWHAGPLLPTTLSPALQPASQPVRAFLQRHGREAAVQRHLAALADFSLLHELLPPPGVGRGRRQLVRPALAALDRSLRRPAGASQERRRLFLQEAYLAYAGAPAAVANPLAAAQRLAAASGLAWRSVLAWAAALLRQHPTLAADPFFAALLQATLAVPDAARPRRAQSATAAAGAAPFSEAAELAWGAVEHYLQQGAAPAADSAARALAALPPAQAAAVLSRARAYLGVATARQRLAALLPLTAPERVLRHWWPAAYRPLAQVARGWLHLHTLGLVQAADGPAGVWAAVLAVAVAGGARPQQLAALLDQLLRAENARRPPAQTARQVLQALLRRRVRVPGPLAALLAARAGEASAGRRAPANAAAGGAGSGGTGSGPALAPGTGAPEGRPGSLKLRPSGEEAGPTETVYIANAGLVLLWPFLVPLFDRLGYLEQRQLKAPDQAERASHLLQFLVTGEEEAPEYLLVLNKLLCGVATARPLARALPLTPAERNTAEGLLQAVITQWQALGNTSVTGLRETFLQRPGKLDFLAERVTLTVETKTVDILVDRLPWSISTIKLPWMPLPLYVTWR
ncbi:contractile injection system tape measure protein [Hymenobacter ruricola]|uniref:Uncharacterized protein n=1 Tax=Hymenobacter ruricola TaxID=2791023 RepID=A0ABS0I7Y4_9BACT|nr:contractile injection system tape measure protein [Hymenobacter ruricola]MBF9222677.1 hypothetical protein [Hymenobacter ruricola]